MKRLVPALLCMALASVQADEKPLTLEEALASADGTHPFVRMAESDVNLALADLQLANSATDASLTFDAALRGGKPTDGTSDWRADNSAKLALRKPLLDFGRKQGQVDAAGQEVAAQRLALLDAKDALRIAIMARFFDVLLADMQFGADNEFMAARYTLWDNSKLRAEQGQLNLRDLAERESAFQDQREKRTRIQLQQRATRQKLANAINQPGKLPGLLEFPVLKQNDTVLPPYEKLYELALQSNRKLQAVKAQLNAVAGRSEAIRASRSPTVDLELSAGDYSREGTTRDRYSGGVVMNWPIYQGERQDARLTKEVAARERLEAQQEKLSRELSEDVLATVQEIEWLRSDGRKAANVQVDYRDKALERARVEYELEMRSNLGTIMADTQAAALRVAQVEYRLALALARLEALIGKPLGDIVLAAATEKK